MRIGIFGSGPAGLLIAHAATLNGVEFDVYSAGGPSELHGAQYLHQPIPGIPDIPVQTLWHQFRGTIEGYRHKVYGMEWDGEVSPELYGGTTSAWDIRHTYDWLVSEYWNGVIKRKVTGWGLLGLEPGQEDLESYQSKYDMIFSTIPLRSICVDPDHKFSATEIWAIGDAPSRGIKNPIPTEASTLVCSGEASTSWYRTCNVFGHSTTEWSKVTDRKRPPIAGVTAVTKPLRTDCNCFLENINRAGRYGEWKKGVLTHQAFRRASDLIHRRLSSGE